MKRIAIAAAVLLVSLVAAVGVRAVVAEDEEPVVVVHWANSHPMRPGLLPKMADDFNKEDHETDSGRPIEIRVVSCDSATQVDDLVSRVGGSGAADHGCAGEDDEPASDPTIVTPQSSDWLIDIDERAGRDVVDVGSPHLAETWLGIVTHQSMAECLGWPNTTLGYATILELAANPEGWASRDCAEFEWGREPLLAFTNPATSTSGRNVLVSLYSMAAGKPPADLTVADITRPDVVEYVQRVQALVDHYLPGTIPVNTKIVQGPAFGHFFLMPEDNLVSLYEGNERAIGAKGTPEKVAPVRDLVMIYPSEGSVLNANPGAIVKADWVLNDEAEAAQEWIDFVRDDDQQQRFVDAGFRPGSDDGPAVDARQFAEWGLNAKEPAAQIEPGELAPPVLQEIVDSWGSVKNPAIVTFVVDVSGSMEGEPLAQVQKGLLRVLDALSAGDAGDANQVGLVTFADTVHAALAPAPLDRAAFDIADAIADMHASGSTALYDAIRRAVELTDAATGDARATRSVVVLSDGAATRGGCLQDLVEMRTKDERAIGSFCGFQDEAAHDDAGTAVALGDIRGESLRVGSGNVQVFFLGFGDADIDIGRILAEATGAEYQGSTDNDLANVIEALSGYF